MLPSLPCKNMVISRETIPNHLFQITSLASAVDLNYHSLPSNKKIV